MGLRRNFTPGPAQTDDRRQT